MVSLRITRLPWVALRRRGFTLIELLVVMAIIATLLTLAAPRYFNTVQKSREAVLRSNLGVMRDAIDKYYGDNGKYPSGLDDLVKRKYLRQIPEDPISESKSTWILVAPADDPAGVFDVKSGATGAASDGTPYQEW